MGASCLCVHSAQARMQPMRATAGIRATAEALMQWSLRVASRRCASCCAAASRAMR
jgi:hypothetical protein